MQEDDATTAECLQQQQRNIREEMNTILKSEHTVHQNIYTLTRLNRQLMGITDEIMNLQLAQQRKEPRGYWVTHEDGSIEFINTIAYTESSKAIKRKPRLPEV